ncbi:YegP family protein [Mycobacteroides abscessus]|uniref:YegP family protein n=1 Tax=Mycobacteroides abscessus TaxID=36809 RepID=UPI00094D30A5
MPGTFVIRRSSDRQYYWYYRASNSEILVTSETYTRKQSALDGIASLKRDVAGATTVDLSDSDT